MEMLTPTIAIVLPCFNEREALPHTIGEVERLLSGLASQGIISNESFILCVDDGSTDDTWAIITGLHEKYENVKGITLTHNRGHQYALLAGLLAVKSRCDAAISMDADMQDDPSAITEMVALFRQGAEIVYGVRKSRDTDTWFKRNSARLYYKVQSLMGLQTVFNHADFRLMSARAIDILGQYGESNLFLRGIIPQIGLHSEIVYYDRKIRVAGESKYPLKKMMHFSVDGITSFSGKPMRWILYTGMLLLLIDIFVSAYVLFSYFTYKTVSGWSSLMLSVWFLGSLILMAIGIVGEYIGKIFMEVKGRPRFNVKDSIGL
ncbi:MAG: glycosyltransferase family 2 protein [Muribaculaceae bacterium]|nr:glycosyltransferase family 2 protein [Muribaculaceae bacterium]